MLLSDNEAKHGAEGTYREASFLFLIELFVAVNFWRRSGTTKAKNGRGESPIVVVGRVDVVGVVEVETERAIKPGSEMCQGEATSVLEKS